MRRSLVSSLFASVALGALLAGCPRPAEEPAPATPLTPLDRAAIARLEAQREAGVQRLIQLASDGDAERRALALRALGRIGSPDAIGHLRTRLTGPDAAAAAAALGIAGATGALEPADAKEIAAALATVGLTGSGRAAVIEALGRLGDAAALAPVTTALASDDRTVAVAAGLALGRLGRAKVPLGQSAELTAIGKSRDDHADVRYAATYALARGYVEPTAPEPAPTDPVVRALTARLTDGDPLVRAVAASGLAARRAVRSATPPLLEALGDADARVAVELVRALGGPASTEATRAALVPYLQKTTIDWAAGSLPASFAHVVLEGLRQQAERAAEPAVRAMYVAIARELTDRPPAGRAADRRRAAAWAHCLALSALARPSASPGDGSLADPAVAMSQLERCGGGQVPEASVRGLALEAVAAGPATAAVRYLLPFVRHPDPRMAVAALAVVPEVWKKASAGERQQLRDALVAAVPRPEPAVAGAAVEAAAALLGEHGAGGELAPLASAIVARIAVSLDDPELVSSILDVVSAAKLDAAPTCQQLRTHVSPTLRVAARKCVTALIGEDPGPAAPSGVAPTPPVDPSKAFEVKRWKLVTSQGPVTIALDPAAAPWHVASLAALTRSNFHDGLLFHRVVPDFVVQGGDPTGTGWGGPPYTLPTETGSLLDGRGDYTVGAVGIADSGKDTGGSQWFAMIGRAPHLAGRYTWIGEVVEGQDVIDRLQIGDTVLRAELE